MPILLTGPYEHAGTHGDPDESYAYAAITRFRVDPVDKTTVIRVHYGNLVEGRWVQGKADPLRLVLRDLTEEQGVVQDPEGELVVAVIRAAVTDFTNLRNVLPKPSDADPDDDYYDALSHALYSWLIAQGYYQGTIV